MIVLPNGATSEGEKAEAPLPRWPREHRRFSNLRVRLFILGVRVTTRDPGEMRLDSAMDELMQPCRWRSHEDDVRREMVRAVFRRRVYAGVRNTVILAVTSFGASVNCARRFVASFKFRFCVSCRARRGPVSDR